MKTVDSQTNAVSAMLAASAPIADLAKGGPHMRTMGKKYLPKFPAETDEDYKARRDSTWLFSGVGKAIGDMCGKVFEQPTRLIDASEQWESWAADIDMTGQDLSVFASRVLDEGLRRGITFIMADAPPREGELTVGEARARNLRPYLTHIRLEDVLGWKFDTSGPSPVLMQWRVMESVDDPAAGEYSDDTIQQVREMVLEGGRVIIRLHRRAKGSEGEYVLHDEYATDFDKIMVAPFYTGRTGLFTAQSPLSEIAEVNLAHWRTQSDKASCLHKALAPLLFFKNFGEDIAVTGAGYGYKANSEAADLKWVEISGAGIEQGRRELEDLEKQMQWLGLMLQSERVSETATGAAIEEGKSITRLKMWADGLQDALELCLQWMADIAGVTDVPAVQVFKDFAIVQGLGLSDVRDMYASGAISQETYILEAQRRGILGENVDPDDETERLEREALNGGPDGI